MPVTFACTCGKKYTAPDEAAGRATKCKACGATIRIPARKTASSRAVPAVAKKTTASALAVPDLDFADAGPSKPKSEDRFQAPTPDNGKPSQGPAAAVYGETSRTKPEVKKAAGLIPWLVILAVVLAVAGVLKFVVLK